MYVFYRGNGNIVVGSNITIVNKQEASLKSVFHDIIRPFLFY